MADPTTRIGKAKGRAGKSNVMRFPDNVGHAGSGGQHYMLIKSYIMNDPRMTTQTKPKAQGKKENLIQTSADKSYAFYIPTGALKQQYDGKYNTLAFGAMTIAAAQGSIDIASNPTASFASAGRQISSFFDTGSAAGRNQGAGAYVEAKAKALGSIISKAGENVAGAAMAGGRGKQFLAAGGAAANQRMALVYDGPGEFRTHQFSFTFWPKNSDEASKVKEITLNLKKSMLPGGQGTDSGQTADLITSAFWGYPDIFQVQFFNGGTEFEDMRIYRSVLKSMTVDFMGAENTIAFHKTDNAPVATKMDLTFQETIHVTNQDIKF